MISDTENDLDYFDKLLSVLEQNSPYDALLEINAIKHESEVIKSGLQLRMLADLDTVLDEQHFYQTACCRLLLRSLELWGAMKAQTGIDPGTRLLKNAVVMSLTATLEDLYFFYKDFGDTRAEDL